MKRTSLHFIVDILALLAFALMSSTGILLHYLLPPGSGRFSTLWDMNRHEWGEIHFWISIALFLLLVVHLLLNWRWIVAIVKGHHQEYSVYRVALGIIGLIALLLFAAIPLLIPVEQGDRSGYGYRGGYELQR